MAYLDLNTAMGYAYLGLNEPEPALEYFQKAVNRIEWQLTKIPSQDRTRFLQDRSFVFTRHEAYLGLIETLMMMGRSPETRHYCSSLELILKAPCTQALPEWFRASSG